MNLSRLLARSLSYRPIKRAPAVLIALAFITGLAAGLVPGGDVARACSCLPPPPPVDALAEADAVFHGRVIRIRWADETAPFGLAAAEVTFEVFDRWKGPEVETFVLFTEASSAMCGYPFTLGGQYIVYAFEDDAGGFGTSHCTRTRPYDEAEAAALGPPTVVAPIVEPPGVPCPGCVTPPAPPEALAEADAVFHGQAIDLRQLREEEELRRQITFRVVTWWKGGSAQHETIYLPHGFWGCERGTFFLNSDSPLDGFIVYAYRYGESGRLEIRLCGRTAFYSADEAAALGPGRPPDGTIPTPTVPGPLPTPTERGPSPTPTHSGPPPPTGTATRTAPPPFPVDPTATPSATGRVFAPYAGAGR